MNFDTPNLRRLDVPNAFPSMKGNRFSPDLSDIKIHQNLVEPIHEAHRIAGDVRRGSEKMLQGLHVMAERINDFRQHAERMNTQGRFEAIAQLRANVPDAVHEGRRMVDDARKRLNEMYERATIADFVTTIVLAEGSNAHSRLPAVDMVPESQLAGRLRDAFERGDRALVAALYHRVTSDPNMKADVKDSCANVLGAAFEPLRECLKRIEIAARTVANYAEHHADKIEAYPGEPDVFRMLLRANEGAVLPSLQEELQAFRGVEALAAANEKTTVPSIDPVILDFDDEQDAMWGDPQSESSVEAKAE